MPIQQVQFRTTPSAARQETLGEGLAKLVLTGMKTGTEISTFEQAQEDAETARIEKARREGDIEYQKNSTIMFNDIQAEYAEKYSQYDFVDPEKPTSEEMISFLESLRKDQSERYDLLTENHQSAYREYHAKLDTRVRELETSEEKQADREWVGSMIGNVTSVQQLDDILDVQMHGTINKKDALKAVQDLTLEKLKHLRTSGQLKGIDGSKAIEGVAGTLFADKANLSQKLIGEIESINKDYRIETEKAKIRGLIIQGKSLSEITTSPDIKDSDKKDIYDSIINTLIANKNYEAAVKLDNINGGKGIAYFETVGKQLLSKDVDISTNAYVVYKNVEAKYTFGDKVEENVSKIDAIAEVLGVSPLDRDGMASIQATMENPMEDQVVSDDDLTKAEPMIIGWSDDKKAFIRREANKVSAYIGRDKAIEFAKDKFDNAYKGLGWTGISKTDDPIGLYGAQTPKDELALKTMLNSESPDDVSHEYDSATGLWLVNDGKGGPVQRMTNKTMKQLLWQGKAVEEVVSIADKAIKSKYGRSVYVDGADTQAKIDNLNAFVANHVRTYLADNGIKLWRNDKEKQEVIKAIEIGVLTEYQETIRSRSSFTESSKRGFASPEAVEKNFADFFKTPAYKEKYMSNAANLSKAIVNDMANGSTPLDFTNEKKNERLKAVRFLRQAENSSMDGRSAFTGLWKPHRSHEGGTDTIGYGHKLTKEEIKSGKIYGYSYKNGLNDEQIEDILLRDIEIHEERAMRDLKEYYNFDDWNSLTEKQKHIAMLYSFNGVLTRTKNGKTTAGFPSFIKGLLSNNIELMRREYKVYSGGRELGRNKLFHKAYLR